MLPNWLAKLLPVDLEGQSSKKSSARKAQEKKSDSIFNARNHHARMARNQGLPIQL